MPNDDLVRATEAGATLYFIVEVMKRYGYSLTTREPADFEIRPYQEHDAQRILSAQYAPR